MRNFAARFAESRTNAPKGGPYQDELASAGGSVLCIHFDMVARKLGEWCHSDV